MKLGIVSTGLGVVVGLLLLTGCDSDSSEADVRIHPSSVTIREGAAIGFEASGGYDYEWSLEHDNWGSLSTRIGSSTTYTSRHTPSTNAADNTQVLTVTSTIEGTSQTNYLEQAEAYITHL